MSSRRHFVQGLAASAIALAAARQSRWASAAAASNSTLSGTEFDLEVGLTEVNFTGRRRMATVVNGQLPAPLLRWREGDEVTLRVTNRLTTPTSIHWHGMILPANMDGVPGLSFAGIAPGETYVYRFPVKQSGTYWYHSHSRFQEQTGLYGAIIIEPKEAPRHRVERDYTVLLSDWTDIDPERIYRLLKVRSDYFNYGKRTVSDFVRDARQHGLRETLDERSMWGKMRMNPTDLADVSGAAYTYLMNGVTPVGNWTGLFQQGERVRLRFINGSSMSIFDIRIPGLQLQVVAVDGQDVEPVTVDEFRLAAAEVLDVIVAPAADQAYTIFAQSIDRSGYARGTLAPQHGMQAETPPIDPRPLLNMTDMNMSAEADKALDDAGVGLRGNGRRTLTYADLHTLGGSMDPRDPTREIELHLTGHMERFMWSFNDEKFSAAEPLRFKYGERLRLVLINDSMMNHPIHLHGMWSEMETADGEFQVRKHTLLVQPGKQLSYRVTADALGHWAYHCHLLYHMEAGMFREVSVEQS
jgi:CopA family copper-resistance protein